MRVPIIILIYWIILKLQIESLKILYWKSPRKGPTKNIEQ